MVCSVRNKKKANASVPFTWVDNGVQLWRYHKLIMSRCCYKSEVMNFDIFGDCFTQISSHAKEVCLFQQRLISVFTAVFTTHLTYGASLSRSHAGREKVHCHVSSQTLHFPHVHVQSSQSPIQIKAKRQKKIT